MRYQISFGAFGPLMRLIGLWKSNSYVEVDRDRLSARMGWAFRTTLPLSSIRSVHPFVGIPGGIGVHGFRGRYLVNGAATGIVSIEVEPTAPATMLGVPVKLSRLSVSLEDPGRFLREVGDQVA